MTTLPADAASQPRPLTRGGLLFVVLYALLTTLLLTRSALLALLPISLVILTVPLLRSPRLAPALLLFFVPLLSGMPRGTILPILRTNELVLIFIFAAFLLTRLLGKMGRPQTTFLDKAFLLFLLARSVLPFLVHPVSFAADPAGMAKFFLAPVQYYLVYRLILGTVHRREDILSLMRVMVASAIIIAVIGLMQASKFPGIGQLYSLYYPSAETAYTFMHSPRVTSLFHAPAGGTVRFHGGGWNVCGFYLSQALLVTVALHRLEKGRLAKGVLTGAAGLLALVMFLTFSFTTLISLGVVLAYLGHRQKRLGRYFLLAAPVALLLILLVATVFRQALEERLSLQFVGTLVPMTFLARIDFWMHRALPEIAHYLILGLGPARVDWIAAESYYLFVVANCGLIGLTGLMAFIVYVWRQWKRLLRKHGTSGLTGTLLLLSFVMFVQTLIANTTGQYFEYSGTSEMLWAIWTLALVAARSAGAGSVDGGPAHPTRGGPPGGNSGQGFPGEAGRRGRPARR